MSNASKLFTAGQQEQIISAIRSAEANSSAELRVHIENNCKGEVLDRAVKIFEELGMNKTELRNGVLIYLAVKDRKSAIIGDQSVNLHVHHDFWTECHAKMGSHFATGDFCGGVCSAITMLETELGQHFPHSNDDVNELPDEISFGK